MGMKMYNEREVSSFLNALITGRKAERRIEEAISPYKGKTGAPEYTLLGAVWASLSEEEKKETAKKIANLPEEEGMVAFASLVRGIEVYGKNKLNVRETRLASGRKEKAVK